MAPLAPVPADAMLDAAWAHLVTVRRYWREGTHPSVLAHIDQAEALLATLRAAQRQPTKEAA